MNQRFMTSVYTVSGVSQLGVEFKVKLMKFCSPVLRISYPISTTSAFTRCVFPLCLCPQPQNILLTCLSPPGDIKIVDFGLARRLGAVGELREILGTPEYVGKVIVYLNTRRADVPSSTYAAGQRKKKLVLAADTISY